MKTYKIGGVAAALTLLLVGSVAQADHDACLAEAEEIVMKTSWLVCDDFGGKYVYDPIWQFKGKKGNGCEVHSKLAKQLYVLHDDPPRDRGKGKGFRLAQGAANSILDHKFEDAILHLQNFQNTIEESAKLNPDTDAEFPEKSAGVQFTAAELADWWKSWAANMESRVAACMPVL
jgi:hypothetical protein